MSFLQVEAALSVCRYIDNIMVHADPFHSYCVALVVASRTTVEDWAAKQGITFSDFSDLCEKEETRKEVQESLLKVCLFLISFLHLNSNFALFRPLCKKL